MGQRIAVTSIIRHASAERVSGLLRVIDLGSGSTLMTGAVPESVHRARDPNPRGGLRGGRGVSFAEDRFVLANAERLFVFDRAWRMVSELTHPRLADVHEVLAEADGVWVTCAGCDLLLQLGWGGEVVDSWGWRRDRRLTARFGFGSLPGLEEGIDYQDPRRRRHGVHDVGHVNAVTRGPGGVIVSLGRVLSPAAYRRRRVEALLRKAMDAAVIARPVLAYMARRRHRRLFASQLPMPDLASGSSALVLVSDRNGKLADAPPATLLARQDGVELPNHNAVVAGDLLVYNDTNRARLVARRLEGSGGERWVAVPGRPAYARGLAWLGEETFVVGSQRPTAVHMIDLGTAKVTSSIVISEDPLESVSSVAVVPESFEGPPQRLSFRRAGAGP